MPNTRDRDTVNGTAVVLTNGQLATDDAKTAHGLIRGSRRFDIVGIIDPVSAGKDAGAVLDGRHRNIPVFSSIAAFVKETGGGADYAIVGVAIAGGMLPDTWHPCLLEAMEHGMSIINGMHQLLNDVPLFRKAAQEAGVDIVDIRKPRPAHRLHFWTGAIYDVRAPIVAVLGMDCAIGKRTTCRLLVDHCLADGIPAEMIYTGQTGWMQGAGYGFIFDATLNDFISGELEEAIVACDRQATPDLIVVEGQSGMRNPSGPCGAEFILSGNAKGVILQHAPFREHYKGLAHLGCRMNDVAEEIALIDMYGARVVAVTLNNEGGSKQALADYRNRLADRLELPVVQPLEDGMAPLMPAVRRFMDK